MQKVKWGILGAGGIAYRRTIPGMLLADNAELYAVMEVDPANAERIRSEFGAAKAYSDEAALINDPGVQAIYIASPVVCHARQARLAAAAGKHILIEKPIALSAAEAAELPPLCEKAGVLAACGFMMRFGAYNMAIKRLIDEGRLGKVVSAKAQFTCWYPDIPGAWRQTFAGGGGGAMMDMGVHCVDLIQHILSSKTALVGALCDTKAFRYEVEDSASVLFRLENGVDCHVEANFNIPDAAARWRMEFYGTGGGIVASDTIGQVDGGSLEVVFTDPKAGYDAAQNGPSGRAASVDVHFGNMYTREIESLSNSILTGAPVEVPLSDAVQIQRVVEAAYESARTGKFIRL